MPMFEKELEHRDISKLYITVCRCHSRPLYNKLTTSRIHCRSRERVPQYARRVTSFCCSLLPLRDREERGWLKVCCLQMV